MPKAPERRDCLAITLRCFTALNFLTGVGFIVYACIIQYPPKSALPL
jgi:hypothetical protein